jgi:hypothetical protein
MTINEMFILRLYYEEMVMGAVNTYIPAANLLEIVLFQGRGSYVMGDFWVDLEIDVVRC